MSSGTGVNNGMFDCALEEVRNTQQGMGAFGFSTYDLPIVPFSVLFFMTVLMIVLVMVLLKRRDSV